MIVQPMLANVGPMSQTVGQHQPSIFACDLVTVLEHEYY